LILSRFEPAGLLAHRRERIKRDGRAAESSLHAEPIETRRRQALGFCFNAFSSREREPASLENTLDIISASVVMSRWLFVVLPQHCL
jgi:hypothetical protein